MPVVRLGASCLSAQRGRRRQWGGTDLKEYIDPISQDAIDDGRIVEDGGELPMPPLPLGAASPGAAFPGGAFPGGAFPIVGVGASAGGLDAFTQLLKHLPTDTGMGFVLIQHLDPTHASFLRDALAKATTMQRLSDAVVELAGARSLPA